MSVTGVMKAVSVRDGRRRLQPHDEAYRWAWKSLMMPG
jgi:hypothetical protein